MRTLQKLCWMAGVLIFVSGCASRAVVIDAASDVVRIGPGVRGHVYVLKNGVWTDAGKVTLPEGWYAGPGPVPDK